MQPLWRMVLHKVLGRIMLKERGIASAYEGADSLPRMKMAYLEIGSGIAEDVLYEYRRFLDEANIDMGFLAVTPVERRRVATP